MLSALVEYMLCMFSIIVYVNYILGVRCVYVVYVEYKWCTRVSNSVCEVYVVYGV